MENTDQPSQKETQEASLSKIRQMEMLLDEICKRNGWTSVKRKRDGFTALYRMPSPPSGPESGH